MEIYLSNKRIEKLVLLVKQENKYHTGNILEFIDFHSIRDEVWNILATKKKTAHAYFGRLYFSKFFGGKMKPF